jgi:orotidine-5'-phosphate decarboxylase
MMRTALETAEAEAVKLKVSRPKMIAVTILTSMDENSLKKIGLHDTMSSQVLRLARLAKEAGLDGVVASPAEAKLIREDIGPDFLIVTPGVRPAWAAVNDQKRIATPASTIKAGADFIVVGRPITDAKDPAEAAREVLKEMGS